MTCLLFSSISSYKAYSLDDKVQQLMGFVQINITDYSTIYEGDLINCSIKGNPIETYWRIDNHSNHYTFYHDNPLIFDPEPTPLQQQSSTLTVYAEYENGTACDSVNVKIHRLFFGDIHFHSELSDGYNPIDDMYQNAIDDNYLDFACLTDHAEIVNDLDHTPPQPLWMFSRSLIQYLRHKLTDYDEWEIIKEKTRKYNQPGMFSTFLGYEYSPGPWYKGGFPWSSDGHEDIGHINFYYKDVYDDAPEYSARDCPTWHDVLDKMNEEHDKGNLNIAFPHHPLATFGIWGEYTVNWTYLAQQVIANSKSSVLMGAEVYSKWGQSIGKYSGIPLTWPFSPRNCRDKPTYWVENGLWEWSEHSIKRPFVMIASSDNHATDRPGSASLNSRISATHPNPAGLIATYSVHNTRFELWDAIAQGFTYGTQQLKIRAQATFNGQHGFGQWINCTKPLNITVSAMSTFPGTDAAGKDMTPHAYSPDELDYPIEDVWIIKKDTEKGQPWCEIIAHEQPQSDVAVAFFEDENVEPNDFYYIVIKQKGQYLLDDSDSADKTNDYLAFLGPIFIRNVR